MASLQFHYGSLLDLSPKSYLQEWGIYCVYQQRMSRYIPTREELAFRRSIQVKCHMFDVARARANDNTSYINNKKVPKGAFSEDV